jgi:hypothetical protein
VASVGGPVATRTLLSARFRRSRRSSSAWSPVLRLMRDGERPRAPDCGSGHARRSPPRRRALRFGCSRTRTGRHGGGSRACRRGENISAKRRRLALWRVSSQSSASGWASGRRLNRSHVPNGVTCSELALHSVLAHSPQPTNARCARGEEPKARSLTVGPALAGSIGCKRSEFLRTISVRLTPQANVRPEIRPQLREFLAWYEEVSGRIDAGAVVAPGEQERLTEEASAVAHLLDLLDSSADEPAS